MNEVIVPIPNLAMCHTFKELAVLIDKYDESHDDTYLHQGLSLFYLWYELHFPKSHDDACYEVDVLSERLKTLSYFLIRLKRMDIHILDDVFIKVISHHAYLLNHQQTKLTHSVNLIIGSVVYNLFYISHAFDDYVETCFKRINRIVNTILMQGIKTVYEGFCELGSLSRFLHDYTDYQKYLPQIYTYRSHLYEYLYAFTYPNGVTCLHGENLKPYPRVILEFPHPLRKHFLSCFFKKKGEMLMRRFFPQVLLLSLHNEHYRLTFSNQYDYKKKLYLNLSLSLYEGQEFLIMTDPRIPSHTLNGRGYLFDRSLAGKATISFLAENDDFYLISGIHALFSDTLVKRTLLALKGSVFIVDTIESKEENHFGVHFPVNPDIKLEPSNNTVRGFKNNEDLFTFSVLYQDTLGSLVTHKNIITYEGKTEKLLVIFHIRLKGDDDKYDVSVTPDSVSINGKESIYHLKITPIGATLFVNKEEAPDQNIKIPQVLLKEIREFYS